jgi:predicted MPP superfamily phosphohydrolase
MNRWAGTVLVLTLGVFPIRPVLGAESAAVKAKQKSESESYIILGNHDEIVEKAKKEGGKLRIIRSLSAETYNGTAAAFKQKYPFITDISAYEFKGTEAPQRFVLELQAGRGREWDVFDVAPEQRIRPFSKEV